MLTYTQSYASSLQTPVASPPPRACDVTLIRNFIVSGSEDDFYSVKQNSPIFSTSSQPISGWWGVGLMGDS